MNRIILLILFFSIFSLEVGASQKNTLTAQKAVLACLGEAEGEQMLGKLALMETLRNRNNVKGVYGIKAITLKNGKYYRGKRQLSSATVTACQSAWVDSKYTNYTNGATGWGNEADLVKFNTQSWFDSCHVTKQIGNHFFYKCN